MTIQAMQQYLYASTYRRYDLLEVPMFGKDANSHHRLQQQHRRLQRSTASVIPMTGTFAGEYASNAEQLQHWANSATVWQCWQLWVKYSLGIQRYEPENSYQLHTVVPSPRALYPIDGYLYLADSTSQSWQIWRYQRTEHQLQLVQQGTDSAIRCNQLQFLLLADDNRILPYYGDYCATLLALETGHLLAQQHLLAAQLGWSLRQDNAPLAGPLSTWLGTQPHLQFCGALQSPQWQTEDAFAQFKQMADGCVHQLQLSYSQQAVDVSQYKLLHAFRQHLSEQQLCAAPATAILSPAAAYRDLAALLAVSRTRTSGNDRHGFVGHCQPLQSKQIQQIWQRYEELVAQSWDRHAWFKDLPVRLYCSLLNTQQAHQSYFWSPNAKGFHRLASVESDQAILTSAATPPTAYNYESFNLVWSIAVNYSALRDMQGHGVLLAQTAAGYLAHLCCLAVTEQQLFARPIKAFHEALLEFDLQQLQHSMVYQVLCGRQTTGAMVYDC